MSVQKVAGIVFFAAIIVVLSLALLNPAVREGTPKTGIAAAVGAPGWVLTVAGIVVSIVFMLAIIFSKPKK